MKERHTAFLLLHYVAFEKVIHYDPSTSIEIVMSKTFFKMPNKLLAFTTTKNNEHEYQSVRSEKKSLNPILA